MALEDAILKVKILDRTELDERFMRSMVKLENDLTVTIPNNLLHFENKVVIPQLIADWLEYFKNCGGTLYGSTNPYTYYGRAITKDFKGDCEEALRWIRDNSDAYARAWLDGYRIEEDRRYIVKVKNVLTRQCALNRNKKSKDFIFSEPEENALYDTKFTRKELEEAGFGWMFDCEGIEIKEIEQ